MIVQFQHWQCEGGRASSGLLHPCVAKLFVLLRTGVLVDRIDVIPQAAPTLTERRLCLGRVCAVFLGNRCRLLRAECARAIEGKTLPPSPRSAATFYP